MTSVGEVGVPPVLLSVICVHMRVAVQRTSFRQFTICNRIWYVCTTAPVVFNLCFCAMVDDWKGSAIRLE